VPGIFFSLEVMVSMAAMKTSAMIDTPRKNQRRPRR
jgi:hypothetical protein